MPRITITRDEALGYPLDEERDELLTFIAEEHAHLRDRKYLHRLVRDRLKQLEAQCKELGLADSDPALLAETRDYVEDLNRRINSDSEDA